MHPSKKTLILIAGMMAQACGAAPTAAPLPTRTEANVPKIDRPSSVPQKKSKAAGSATVVDGVSYGSLDEYLARLERDGWVGKAWYKEVRPGVYELVTNVQPPPEQRLFTRAELEQKFGFAR